jgi:hypothetical protein
VSAARQIKDPKTYSIYELLAAGMRFADDYTEEDAIEAYMALHPDAIEDQVRAELQAETVKHG